jgi:hypothetical protein
MHYPACCYRCPFLGFAESSTFVRSGPWGTGSTQVRVGRRTDMNREFDVVIWPPLRLAMPVNSVRLSDTHIAGRPSEAIEASSSRTTRSPGKEVSGISARRSCVSHRRSPGCGSAGRRRKHPIGSPGSTADWGLQQCHRRSRAQGSLAPATAPYLQPLIAVEPSQLLAFHDNALAPEQDVQSPIAEPPAHGGRFAQPPPVPRQRLLPR